MSEKLRRVITDHDLRERIIYHDASLPVEICIDDYSTLYDHTLNCHWHDEFEFDLLISGKVEFFINGERFLMKKGDCVFVNSGVMHTASSIGDENAVMLVTVMGQELIAPSLKGSIYQGFIVPVLSSSGGCWIKDEAVLEKIREIHALKESDPGFALDVLSSFASLWRLAFSCITGDMGEKRQSGGEKEERVKALISYIRSAYSEELTVSDLAAVSGFSRSELYRSFSVYANCDPMEYVSSCRLSAASQLLIEGEMGVTEIALATGFSSAAYFGKFFRRHTGLSPREFRKKHISSSDNLI